MHAVLLATTFEIGRTQLPAQYQRESADVRHFTGVRMGIDEVRTLIREAYLTPIQADERIFILGYSSFTEEAQNALLKLLEEPPKTARLYVITELPNLLLLTLRSRLIEQVLEDTEVSSFNIDSFLRLSYGERLAHIVERAQKKDDPELIALIEAIEEWSHIHRDKTLMHAIVALKEHFHVPGASKKMILEHLSLLLPSHRDSA